MLPVYYIFRRRPPLEIISPPFISLRSLCTAQTLRGPDGVAEATGPRWGASAAEIESGGKSEATTLANKTDGAAVVKEKRPRGRPRKKAKIELDESKSTLPQSVLKKVNLKASPEPNPEIVRKKKTGILSGGGQKRRNIFTIKSSNDSIAQPAQKIPFTSNYISKGRQLSELDPLTRSLFEEYKRDDKVNRKRVNVVGSQLCDDIVERMKPTLMKHVGCDIIDINPGPGVWSAAIHNLLKPRTHVLMEPEPKLYGSHLQRLIDADSSYKLFPKFGLEWEHFLRVTSPEFLPHQVELNKDNPRIDEPNNTLLLIANLGYHPKKVYRGFSSVAQLFMYQLLAASRTHSLCHKYGLVRMLIWVSDDERHLLQPRTGTGRRKSVVTNQIICESIEEVASSPSIYETNYRDHWLSLESSIKTLARMKAAGISTPPGRDSPLEQEASSGAQVPPDRDTLLVIRKLDKLCAELEKAFAEGKFEAKVENPVQLSPGFNRTPEYYQLCILEQRERRNSNIFQQNPEQAVKLKELRAKLRSGEIQKYIIPEDQVVPNSRRHQNNNYTPEYALLMRLRVRIKSDANRERKFYTLMQEYNAILKLQAMAREPSATESTKDEAKRRTTLWKDTILNIPKEQQTVFWVHHENQLLFENDPPVLFWDRRRAEPLMVKADEFFPNQNLALLDFQPGSLWSSLQKGDEGSWSSVKYIINHLMTQPTRSLKEALSGLAPNCFEWMIAKCPSLTDPSKGGNMDPEAVRVRILTTEMWKEIFEAWQIWPYKLSDSELGIIMATQKSHR